MMGVTPRDAEAPVLESFLLQGLSLNQLCPHHLGEVLEIPHPKPTEDQNMHFNKKPSEHQN